MPLITSAQMLMDAQRNGYAVGAFNIENMEMEQAVIAAAEELNAPVIIQTTPSTVRYASPELYFAVVSTLEKKTKIPVAMHLDHGDSFDLAVRAIRAGYTSIMQGGVVRAGRPRRSTGKRRVRCAISKTRMGRAKPRRLVERHLRRRPLHAG